ncbi:RagB/SusD family nutrient uptake outer membrane protein [Mucilaginibacter sp. P25]|uniref:RagB/SusD family nutrient uptake outer membrane protein n=1 Tax=Mucilaginibacter sp. P25 TaxID=3423945 RepID=UPI003D7B33F6
MTILYTSKYKRILFSICVLSLIINACKKQDDWLNVKSIKSDVTPKTMADFQAILDNATQFNTYGSIIGLMGTDNLYVPDVNLDAEPQLERNTYLWAKDIYQGATAYDWYYLYQSVEYANVVLDGLSKLKNLDGNQVQADNIKGQALFFRSFAFYQLSQLYCKPYNKATATVDAGIPVRLTLDVNVKVSRGNVQQCYDQMIGDLKLAISLLATSPLYKTRPAKPVANGLLAKVYLSMGDYLNAFNYADAALKLNGDLLDFNTLSQTSTAPFPTFAQGNGEIGFYAYCYGTSMTVNASYALGKIDPNFYNTYDDSDLRRGLFFTTDGKGFYRPKAGFAARANNFCGIANDEIYLIRSESAARTANTVSALADLNLLLQKRITTAAFKPFTDTDPEALLSKILSERQKRITSYR